ncbi:MAG: hypothetical protein HQK83_05605 [Fibrobacteria bacterium]|nr:hypothetical protein [Fibrobacteria bacterium]
MGKKERQRIVNDASTIKDGKKRLSCTKAFKLNKTFRITLREIGNTCNELGIKISRCQLGCFK